MPWIDELFGVRQQLRYGLNEPVAALVDGSSHWGALESELMAASVVVSLPIVAGFLDLQRYLVRGLTAGSVK